MKKALYGVLLLALVACGERATETTSTTETSATTVTTGTSVTSGSGAIDTSATTATSLTDSSATAAPTSATAAPTTTTTGSAPAAVTKPAPAAPKEKAAMSSNEKVAVLKTSKGEISIRFFPDLAPGHVKNFLDLAQKGFYNGTKFHRVIPGFMIQGGDPNTISGDPNTWGTGGSPNRLKAEFSKVPHRRGIVSMARSADPDSASSQFFIVVADSTFLDNKYSVFGQVTKGMEVADAIVNGARGPQDRPFDPVSIESITIRPANADETGPAPK